MCQHCLQRCQPERRMLVLGLAPMLAVSLPARLRAGRFWTGLASGVGMIEGMAWGASLALRWAGPMRPRQFLIALAGMTLGMLAGMIFACELARASTSLLFARQRL